MLGRQFNNNHLTIVNHQSGITIGTCSIFVFANLPRGTCCFRLYSRLSRHGGLCGIYGQQFWHQRLQGRTAPSVSSKHPCWSWNPGNPSVLGHSVHFCWIVSVMSSCVFLTNKIYLHTYMPTRSSNYNQLYTLLQYIYAHAYITTMHCMVLDYFGLPCLTLPCLGYFGIR